MASQAIIIANQQQTKELHPVFTKVYGLTVIERTLHALDRAGIEKAYVIGGDNQAQLNDLLSKNEFQNLELATVNALAAVDLNVEGEIFVVSSPVVVSIDLFKELRKLGQEAMANATVSDHGILYLKEAAAIKNQLDGGTEALKNHFEQAKVIDASQIIYTPITTKVELKSTKKALIKSLTKSTDGWVSRNLNRPISTLFSRVLAHTSVTPNQFTIFTGVIALITGYFMAAGGYWNWLIAAFLFHMTSVMDGVDGELARLKFKSSPFGQWLDTVVDNLSYVVGLGGLVYGVYQYGMTPAVKWSGILAVAFAVAALGSLYLYLLRFGKGGTLLNVEYGYQNSSGWYSKVMNVLAAFGKRDLFALIFLILAIFGQLPMALSYVAIMAAAVFGFSIQAHLIASRTAVKE